MYSKVASRYFQSHDVCLYVSSFWLERFMQTTQNVNKTPIFCLLLLITLLSVVKKQKMPKTFIVGETREPLKAFPNKRILHHLRQFLQLQQLIQEVIYFHHSETSVWKYLCQFIYIEVHLFASGDSQLSHVFLISATEVMIAQPQPPNSPEYKTGWKILEFSFEITLD